MFRVGGGGASAVELVAELLGAGLERCDVTGERLRLCLGLRRALRERIRDAIHVADADVRRIGDAVGGEERRHVARRDAEHRRHASRLITGP